MASDHSHGNENSHLPMDLFQRVHRTRRGYESNFTAALWSRRYTFVFKHTVIIFSVKIPTAN
ncbi:hypothetical protein GBA52_022009 [Prunus armeniaca]|nr:hypothetical protein GBA52_022009 [Prunus armeniaca]